VTSLVLAPIFPPKKILYIIGTSTFLVARMFGPKKNPLNVAAEVQHPDYVAAKTFIPNQVCALARV